MSRAPWISQAGIFILCYITFEFHMLHFDTSEAPLLFDMLAISAIDAMEAHVPNLPLMFDTLAIRHD